MNDEPIEARLARIEESQKGIREDLRFYHEEMHKPLAAKVAAVEKEVTITKRDRVWVSALVGAFVAWLGDKFWRG